LGGTDHIIHIFPGLSQFLCIVETSKWPNRDTTTADDGSCDAAAARHLSDFNTTDHTMAPICTADSATSDSAG
jgi:hypothetical protein